MNTLLSLEPEGSFERKMVEPSFVRFHFCGHPQNCACFLTSKSATVCFRPDLDVVVLQVAASVHVLFDVHF